ncbi:MAG: bile acid:sodium symporter family protein [Myxococcota bacterium]
MRVLIGIVLGAAVAFAAPDLVLWAEPGLQPAFAVTMLLVGSLVRRDQLRAFAAAPLRAGAGLVAQYTLMPLMAWAISLGFGDPTVRTGIVLVGCMPGAMASNVMTVLLRGDLVLSVTMTTLATLACPLVLAAWLPLLADTRMAVPVGALVWNATWMVVLPVTAGIVLRAARPALPGWWDRAATAVAAAAIVLIVLVVVAANRDALEDIGPALAIAMVALNVAAYAAAHAFATLLRWPAAQRRTLVVEVGMQNAGLGSVLALAHLGAAGAVPSAFYTALCVITASLALPFVERLRARSRTSSA